MKRIQLLLIIAFSITTLYSQTTIQRRVLFEEATNASCGPCASNNPTLKAYINSKGDSIIPIMYHASWPGADPMYSANPTQNSERISYMGVSAVPHLNIDGVIYDVWPFSNTNFENAFRSRMAILTPVAINIIEARIAGDSIKAVITVQILSPLTAGGNYKLRVFAVEKKITYSTPPGSNGETVFEYVFRRAYPNTSGTSIPIEEGMHTYTFTYKREANWVDSMIYTTAFVQNDIGKEVLNAASSLNCDPILPVELLSFSAESSTDGITLKWETASEINNMGFEIERSTNSIDFVKTGFVKGNGTSTEKRSYSYNDPITENGKYYFRLRQVDYDGKSQYSNTIEIEYRNTPENFALSQNYPNPFNPVTTIQFAIPSKTNVQTSNVKLVVYDIMGREVALLLNEMKEPGNYEVKFDAAGLTSGVYYYSLTAGSFSETKMMLLLK